MTATAKKRQQLLVGGTTDDFAATRQVIDGHIAGYGGFLQQHNELIGQGRQGIFQRLRNDDIPWSAQKLSPRLRPASLCPLSTDIIPARIISATYAPELMPKHSIATGTPFRAEVKMTKEHDEQLDHHRRAADNGQIYLCRWRWRSSAGCDPGPGASRGYFCRGRCAQWPQWSRWQYRSVQPPARSSGCFPRPRVM